MAKNKCAKATQLMAKLLKEEIAGVTKYRRCGNQCQQHLQRAAGILKKFNRVCDVGAAFEQEAEVTLFAGILACGEAQHSWLNAK